MARLTLLRLPAATLSRQFAGLAAALACCVACGEKEGAPTPSEPLEVAQVLAPAVSNELGIPPLVAGDRAESARPEQALEMELVSTDPERQRRGYNAFTVRFSDLSHAPYEPAAATAVPWMPQHGHGTAVAASVYPGPNSGEWVIDNLNLFMPSYWKIYVFVCASTEEHCCDASTEPCDETSDSLVDTLFFEAWIPS